MFQVKEHDKNSEKELNKLELANLSNEEFKVNIIKILTNLRRKMDEQFHKKTKKITLTLEHHWFELCGFTRICRFFSDKYYRTT